MNYFGAGAAALAGPLLAWGGFQAVNTAGAVLLLPAVVAVILAARHRDSQPRTQSLAS
jgi:predicted MFS family arabinose efflux permease